MNERKLFKDPTFTEQFRKVKRHREREEKPALTLKRMRKAQEKRDRRKSKVQSQYLIKVEDDTVG